MSIVVQNPAQGMAAPLHRPASIEEAVAALSGHDAAGREVVAGATWVMRGPLRGEEAPVAPVFIAGIDELRQIEISPDGVSIGACVTHAALAAALAPAADLSGLATAAGKSANPAIRAVATVGGNLCAAAFAAADLVPALLALDASVDYASADGVRRMSLEDFLAARKTLRGGLLARVHVRRGGFRSAHQRLPMRKAGDYPVAIVSVAAELQPDGTIVAARIAVGSVEPVARRWTGLEQAIAGTAAEPEAIGERAAALSHEFSGRDGVEAPGWYRVKVLPVLVRRAFEALTRQ